MPSCDCSVRIRWSTAVWGGCGGCGRCRLDVLDEVVSAAVVPVEGVWADGADRTRATAGASRIARATPPDGESSIPLAALLHLSQALAGSSLRSLPVLGSVIDQRQVLRPPRIGLCGHRRICLTASARTASANAREQSRSGRARCRRHGLLALCEERCSRA